MNLKVLIFILLLKITCVSSMDNIKLIFGGGEIAYFLIIARIIVILFGVFAMRWKQFVVIHDKKSVNDFILKVYSTPRLTFIWVAFWGLMLMDMPVVATLFFFVPTINFWLTTSMNKIETIPEVVSESMRNVADGLREIRDGVYDPGLTWGNMLKSMNKHKGGLLACLYSVQRNPDPQTLLSEIVKSASFLGLEDSVINVTLHKGTDFLLKSVEKVGVTPNPTPVLVPPQIPQIHEVDQESLTDVVESLSKSENRKKVLTILGMTTTLGGLSLDFGDPIKILTEAQKSGQAIEKTWERLEEALNDLGLIDTGKYRFCKEIYRDFYALQPEYERYQVLMHLTPAEIIQGSNLAKWKQFIGKVDKIRLATSGPAGKDLAKGRLFVEINQLVAKTAQWRKIVEHAIATSGTRPCPVGVTLVGESQLGKTMVSSEIFRRLKWDLKSKSEDDGVFSMANEWSTWNVQSRDEYDQGYVGQEFVYMDDAFADKDNKDHLMLLQYISSGTVGTVQADLDLKGSPFQARVVVASCNYLPDKSVTINNINALHQRFPVCLEVKLKEGAKKLSPDSVYDQDFKHLEFYMNTMQQTLSCNGNHSSRCGCKRVSIDEIVNRISNLCYDFEKKYQSCLEADRLREQAFANLHRERGSNPVEQQADEPEKGSGIDWDELRRIRTEWAAEKERIQARIEELAQKEEEEQSPVEGDEDQDEFDFTAEDEPQRFVQEGSYRESDPNHAGMQEENLPMELLDEPERVPVIAIPDIDPVPEEEEPSDQDSDSDEEQGDEEMIEDIGSDSGIGELYSGEPIAGPGMGVEDILRAFRQVDPHIIYADLYEYDPVELFNTLTTPLVETLADQRIASWAVQMKLGNKTFGQWCVETPNADPWKFLVSLKHWKIDHLSPEEQEHWADTYAQYTKFLRIKVNDEMHAMWGHGLQNGRVLFPYIPLITVSPEGNLVDWNNIPYRNRERFVEIFANGHRPVWDRDLRQFVDFKINVTQLCVRNVKFLESYKTAIIAWHRKFGTRFVLYSKLHVFFKQIGVKIMGNPTEHIAWGILDSLSVISGGSLGLNFIAFNTFRRFCKKTVLYRGPVAAVINIAGGLARATSFFCTGLNLVKGWIIDELKKIGSECWQAIKKFASFITNKLVSGALKILGWLGVDFEEMVISLVGMWCCDRVKLMSVLLGVVGVFTALIYMYFREQKPAVEQQGQYGQQRLSKQKPKPTPVKQSRVVKPVNIQSCGPEDLCVGLKMRFFQEDWHLINRDMLGTNRSVHWHGQFYGYNQINWNYMEEHNSVAWIEWKGRQVYDPSSQRWDPVETPRPLEQYWWETYSIAQKSINDEAVDYKSIWVIEADDNCDPMITDANNNHLKYLPWSKWIAIRKLEADDIELEWDSSWDPTKLNSIDMWTRRKFDWAKVPGFASWAQIPEKTPLIGLGFAFNNESFNDHQAIPKLLRRFEKAFNVRKALCVLFNDGLITKVRVYASKTRDDDGQRRPYYQSDLKQIVNQKRFVIDGIDDDKGIRDVFNTVNQESLDPVASDTLYALCGTNQVAIQVSPIFENKNETLETFNRWHEEYFARKSTGLAFENFILVPGHMGCIGKIFRFVKLNNRRVKDIRNEEFDEAFLGQILFTDSILETSVAIILKSKSDVVRAFAKYPEVIRQNYHSMSYKYGHDFPSKTNWGIPTKEVVDKLINDGSIKVCVKYAVSGLAHVDLDAKPHSSHMKVNWSPEPLYRPESRAYCDEEEKKVWFIEYAENDKFQEDCEDKLEYTGYSQSGDCGSPLVIWKSNVQHKLLGFHVYGRDNRTYSSLWNYECIKFMVDKVRKEFNNTVPVEQQSLLYSVQYTERTMKERKAGLGYLQIQNWPEVQWSDADHFAGLILGKEKTPGPDCPIGPSCVSFGRLPKSVPPTSLGETKWRKSPFWGAFDVHYEPAVLSIYDKRLTAYPPPNRMGNPSLLTRPAVLRTDVSPPMSKDMLKSLDACYKYMLEEYKILFEDALIPASSDIVKQIIELGLNSHPKFESVQPLDISNSSGFPWIEKGKKKNFWVELNERTGERRICQPVLFKVLSQKICAGFSLRRTTSFTVTKLKDELVSLKKIEIGKTRTYNVAPIEEVIMSRGVYAPLVHAYYSKSKAHAVGIDVHSIQWDIMIKRLLKFKNFINLDYSEYDCRQRSVFARIAYSILIHGAPKEELKEVTNLRFVIAETDINTLMVDNDSIYMVERSNKSGITLTTMINCLVNELQLMYAFERCLPEEKRTDFYTLWKENVEFVCFGDDVLMSVSDEVKEIFNYETIARELTLIGHVITPGNKSGEVYKTCSLEECTFLKRSFKPDRWWLGCLDKKAIEKCFSWSKLPPTCITEWKLLVEDHIFEAVLHGEEYGNYFISRLYGSLNKKKVSPEFKKAMLPLLTRTAQSYKAEYFGSKYKF